jgi:hypothetical protein
MFTLLLSLAFAGAPDPELVTEQAPVWLENGGVLTYSVQPPEKDAYDFVVTVMATRPDRTFRWTMSTGQAGERTTLAADRSRSRMLSDHFIDGESGARTRATSMWISERAFADIAKKGTTKIWVDGNPIPFAYDKFIRWPVGWGEETRELIGLHMVSVTKGVPDGQIDFIVLANREEPLVLDLEARGGFAVWLRTVQEPSGD